MRYALNMLMRGFGSIVVFVLFMGVPFIICLAISQHSAHPLWALCIAPISFAAFLMAVVSQSHRKEEDSVYYGKAVLRNMVIWIILMCLIGLLAYLPRSWGITFVFVFGIAYLFLTEQLVRMCLCFIWRREKIALA